jgi:hypothetical protein
VDIGASLALCVTVVIPVFTRLRIFQLSIASSIPFRLPSINILNSFQIKDSKMAVNLVVSRTDDAEKIFQTAIDMVR